MIQAHWQNSRKVVERIWIEGDLVLESPAHFGGDSDGLADMPLLADPLEGRALLMGASLAGALRNYLRERELGYQQPETLDCLAALVFGQVNENAEGEQSPLIVYDALGPQPTIEMRDGVAIVANTRTAEPKKKYDIELLSAGTIFSIRLELLLTEPEHKELLRGAAMALQGLERGEIRLGARKRRGFGQCRVQEWRVRRYDVKTARGLIGWLEDDRTEEKVGRDIASLLQATETELDTRQTFTVQAHFRLDGSLLIRSGSGQTDMPDMVHLHSKRGGTDIPVLSGTSLTGALRARAFRIAKTVGVDSKAGQFVDQLFGPRIESHDDKPRASRLVASEAEIMNPLSLVQTRVKIDRFTGGSFPTALFSEQPVFGTTDTRLTINLTVRSPSEGQVGLVLLLLKDLWTGDLPLGGEASVGRGRLSGESATVSYVGQTWRLSQTSDRLIVEGDREKLEYFVEAFRREVGDET